MNRRQFLAGACTVGGAFFLVGCGSSTPDPVTGATFPSGPTVLQLQGANPDFLTVFGPGGRLYRLFPYQHRVERLSSDGSVIWTIQGPGQGPGEVTFPTRLVADENGTIYLLDSAEFGISVWNDDGQYVRQILTESSVGLSYCDGELYAPGSNFQIQVYSAAQGTLLREFGSFGEGPGQFFGPGSLDFDEEKRLHILDYGNVRINVFNKSGNFLYTYGKGLLSHPVALAADGRGRVVVIDGAGRALWEFSTDGAQSTRYDIQNADGQSIQPLLLSLSTDGSPQILVDLFQPLEAQS